MLLQIYWKLYCLLVPCRELLPGRVAIACLALSAANFERNKSKCMTNLLTDANFDALVSGSGKLEVVDFWATWCPPCIALGPVMDALANSYSDKINVGKLNVDENPEVSVRFGITNLPCILFMHKGQVVHRMVGAAAKPVYEKKIRELLDRL